MSNAADPRPAAPEARGPDAPSEALAAARKRAIDRMFGQGDAGAVVDAVIAAALRAHPAGEPSHAHDERLVSALAWADDLARRGQTIRADDLRAMVAEITRGRAHSAAGGGEREALVWRAAAEALWPANKPKPDEPEWMGNFEDYAREYADQRDYYTAEEFRGRAAPPPEGTEHE